MSMSTEELLRLTVAALMNRTGERQQDLAVALGLNKTQLSRRQAAKSRWTLDDCDTLAAHYGMPVLDLLAGPTHAAGKLSADRLSTALGGAQTLIPVPTSTTQPAPRSAAPPVPADRPEAAPAPQPAAPVPAPAPQAAPVPASAAWDAGPDGLALQGEPAPCVVCGKQTTYRAGGAPQHLGGLCGSTPAAAAPAPAAAAAPPTEAPAPAPAPVDAPVDAKPVAAAPPARRRPVGLGAGSLLESIADRVGAALREHNGDVETATAGLVKKAIPDVMALFKESRVGGRYEHTEFHPTQDLLKKPGQKEADSIWEGRPKWRNKQLLKAVKAGELDPVEVTGLDMNAAYLSAMKTYLPIGKLVHDTSGVHDTKRAGLHLVTPPDWDHPDLPSPIGNRVEPGPLWLTEPTLRLLLRCARMDLCEDPVIHESWTSGGTESMLEKLRRALADARKTAIENSDEVTLEYVKAMYSKFVSTIGQSTHNRDIRRPDWMHIIRSQAFANLWLKAHKAHTSGLTVVEMSGTDELHVTGEWRQVFPEGRNLAEVKAKHQYTIGG
ncbi:acyltransferase [Streptomyces olivoreticuli]|uniref:acyltransferase n=1 Tax=Streptomyces olivoreticuli TaxID=68246 RepID=UPI002659453A|nr:acyltransferase [Streptomyces olivoreticuli]WKK24142.1 acyltransferase [Streptomyces olivoreticuli]